MQLCGCIWSRSNLYHRVMHISDMNNWGNHNIKDAECTSFNCIGITKNSLLDFLKWVYFFSLLFTTEFHCGQGMKPQFSPYPNIRCAGCFSVSTTGPSKLFWSVLYQPGQRQKKCSYTGHKKVLFLLSQRTAMYLWHGLGGDLSLDSPAGSELG